MPRRKPTSSRSGFWRISALALAAGLGITAVCLVVFSSSVKPIRLGLLLGVWAVFIAASLMFGSRRGPATDATSDSADLQTAEAHAFELQAARLQVADLQAAQLATTRDVHQVQELELRRFGELQLARETAARREADYRLELALRGEMERVLGDQIGVLREEISSLRAEVVDKLGGQLRLERIETTRVIASDLEALQNEIKRLGIAKATPPAAAQPPAPARVSEQETRHEIIDAELVESPVAPPAPEQLARVTKPQPSTTPLYSPAPLHPPVAPPVVAPPVVVGPPEAPAVAVVAATSRPADYGRDPFANLPRLTPLTDDVAELLEQDDPAPTRKQAKADHDQAEKRRSGKRRAPDSQPEDPRYAGRRRAASDHTPAERASGGRRRAPAPAD